MANDTIHSRSALRQYFERERGQWPELTRADLDGIAQTAIFRGERLRSIDGRPLRERFSAVRVQRFMTVLVNAVGGQESWSDHVYGEGPGTTRGCKPEDGWYCIPE
jgi:hypothetical protein